MNKDDKVKFWWKQNWHYGIVDKVGTRWIYIKVKPDKLVKLRIKTSEIYKLMQ